MINAGPGPPAACRDGGGRDGGRAGGRAAGGGGGCQQRGVRGGPAALLAARPQERAAAVPGRFPPAGPSPAAALHRAAAALHRVRGAARRGASDRRPTAAQGLPGGVGAGDGVLLPADRARRPPLFARDPRCARPRGRGPGPGRVQEGAVAGAAQPPPGAVRLLQLGRLRPGGPVLVTGPQGHKAQSRAPSVRSSRQAMPARSPAAMCRMGPCSGCSVTAGTGTGSCTAPWAAAQLRDTVTHGTVQGRGWE